MVSPFFYIVNYLYNKVRLSRQKVADTLAMIDSESKETGIWFVFNECEGHERLKQG